MTLERVGLYPAQPTRLAVFDYTLDGRISQYVVCVSFDSNGAVTSVEMES